MEATRRPRHVTRAGPRAQPASPPGRQGRRALLRATGWLLPLGSVPRPGPDDDERPRSGPSGLTTPLATTRTTRVPRGRTACAALAYRGGVLGVTT